MTGPTAYPLQWPAGKARTPSHKRVRAPFHSREQTWHPSSPGGIDIGYITLQYKAISFSIAIDRLRNELAILGVRNYVISTNLTLKVDGWPRSGQAEPPDPGVAVYFTLAGDPVALAVDRYTKVADNIIALTKHINASRAIERYGVGTLREIFRGYNALPSNAGINPDDWRAALNNPTTIVEAESFYRMRMKDEHPDLGGSEVEAAKLNAAIARAREVLA